MRDRERDIYIEREGERERKREREKERERGRETERFGASTTFQSSSGFALPPMLHFKPHFL